jgi:hypothetical protein
MARPSYRSPGWLARPPGASVKTDNRHHSPPHPHLASYPAAQRETAEVSRRFRCNGTSLEPNRRSLVIHAIQRLGRRVNGCGMRITYPLLAACLLALVAVVPQGANAREAARPASCSAPARGWAGETTGTKIKASHPAIEQRVIVLVNRFRRRHGLRPLKLDPGLRYAARARGVIDKRRTARLALYSPSRCIAESIAVEHGHSGAADIVRRWRSARDSRHVLLSAWIRRIGVGVRVGAFNGQRVTIATADFSAAPPKLAKRKLTTPAPPVAAPVAAPVASGPVVGVPYICDGPVSGVRVVGTAADSRALVVLGPGCTGSLSFDIHITSGGGDGVKVQGGAHDLTIGPSSIVCDPLTNTSFHQDGVQVQGGTNVTFNSLSVVCPFVTGEGAAAFYIDGKDFGGISNVVCDGCNLEHLHYGALFTGPAPGSGVRNSIIHEGALTHSYYEKSGDLTGVVDSNNTLAPPCDGVTVPC